jgi:endo-1,4-beta-xylanase
MMSRRRMLAGGASVLAAPALAQNSRSLRAMGTSRDLLLGSAVTTTELQDNDCAALLKREAAILVPEYEMKRKEIEPQRGRFEFSAMDTLLAFAGRNNMAMRGHPLVWHAANPPWLAQALAQQRNETLLTGYVGALLGRYRGQFHSVDVVNEAINADANGLRPSPWLSALGPGYVDLAFHAAKAADPSVLLVYNDYGCELGAPLNDRFRSATLRFLDGLLARRVPVEALGLQSHLIAFGPRVDQRKLHDFLGEVQARGLGLLVTELDVDDSGGPLDFSSRDRAVADETRRFLDVVLDAPNLHTVLTWGLSDRYLDPPDDWKLKLMGWRGRKLPYDTQMRRKPMWDAMMAALAGRRTVY